MDFEQIIKIAGVVIASLAFVVSFFSLIIAMRSYSVSHRPYIGISAVPFEYIENPPRAMRWKVILKNVGPIPGFFTIEKNVAKLKSNSQSTQLPILGSVEKFSSLLMPGETTELIGQYTEVGGPVTMAEILSGQTTLEIELKVKYEFPSWLWRGRRKLNTKLQFQVIRGVEPGFIMAEATAN
ncbi:hypothetical protein ACONUD_10170 [Microbulbifer harenosus]|uniref:Water stress and hypersensitive response domain-containing protein n=1 Tax=Microbulbifer harenosus TaxID=2576840 RepID=A0ABY2UGI9_9GAMM|nr:hypothetical protein [Microbulbifer harenosus]TLM76693.1 hypothetical protein FDY93_12050 [Microbulbifer harenosus]